MNAVAAAQAKGWRAIYLNRVTPLFWGMHVAAVVGVIALGWSWSGVALAAAVYAAKMFFVTGGYHRYFSHRAYKTSRPFQFFLAFGAEATLQKGVLWWAANHRHHHKASDQGDDLHSPYHGGFWWSHMGWILSRDFEGTDMSRMKDMAKYPEIRWIDRYWWIPAVVTAVLLYVLGGMHALVWGFAVAQVFCWHGTFTINSLSHVWGGKRYASGDDSRNNPILGLLTLGEGWHNNHHHYQVAARQGFFWWEIDITYYILRGFAALGLVWDLHGVPDHVRATTLASTAASLSQSRTQTRPMATPIHGHHEGAAAGLVAAVAAVTAPVMTRTDDALAADRGIVAACDSRLPMSSFGEPSSS